MVSKIAASTPHIVGRSLALTVPLGLVRFMLTPRFHASGSDYGADDDDDDEEGEDDGADYDDGVDGTGRTGRAVATGEG